MEAEIRLCYKNEREADAIVKAISPDNVDVPPGLYIRTLRHGSVVQTNVDCQTRLQTLIATIDDLLACVSMAEKSLTIIKK